MRSTTKTDYSYHHTIFVDSSAWIKIGLEKERGHKEAVSIYRELVQGSKLYTSTYIIDEVLTRLITTQIFVEAKRFYEKIYEAEKRGALTIVKVDADAKILRKAWGYFVKFQEHKLSFTDAATVAIVKKEKIDAVFSYDGDFNKVGVLVIS